MLPVASEPGEGLPQRHMVSNTTSQAYPTKSDLRSLFTILETAFLVSKSSLQVKHSKTPWLTGC